MSRTLRRGVVEEGLGSIDGDAAGDAPDDRRARRDVTGGHGGQAFLARFGEHHRALRRLAGDRHDREIRRRQIGKWRRNDERGQAGGTAIGRDVGHQPHHLGCCRRREPPPPSALLRRLAQRDDAEIVGLGDMGDHRGRSGKRLEIDREAEIEARHVPHPLRLGIDVHRHVERRLQAREGGDDLAPDMLDGGERQDSVVARHEAAHHVGLAAGTEGGAGTARALGADERVDDGAALHQEAVDLLVDPVDLGAKPCESRRRAFAFLGHYHFAWKRMPARGGKERRLIGDGAAKIKENIDSFGPRT